MIIWVKWISWVSAAVAVLLWAQGPAFAQPLFNTAQDPVAGSRVFGSKGCSKCHSIDGLGGKTGPDLARIPRARSFYDLAAAMWNRSFVVERRVEGQKSLWPQFRADEMADLAAFLQTFGRGKS